MVAVLHYEDEKLHIWKRHNETTFNALIKFFIQRSGTNHFEAIEKPSKRPTTLTDCLKATGAIKKQYGKELKQLVIWNMDEMSKYKSSWENRTK